jgi:amino acid transporter
MVLGVLLVILIYVLVNIAFVRVLGISRMAGDPFVAASAGNALFGARGDLVIRLLVLVSILSGMNACALMAPRILLALSRDRLLPETLQTVNAGAGPRRWHTGSQSRSRPGSSSRARSPRCWRCARSSSWSTTPCRL